MVRVVSLAICLFCMLSDSPIGAGTIEDFEGAWGGAGNIVVDPDNAGNNVLHLVSGQTASFPQVGDGIITFDVYDFGAVAYDDTGAGNTGGNNYGPRWGAAGNSGTTSAAATIINRSSADSRAGYYWSDVTTMTGSWFSPQWYGSPRFVDSLAVIGSGTPDAPETPGDGAWTTWSVKVLGGEATITDNRSGHSVTAATFGDLSSIWLSGGGNGSLATVGVLFDNVTFTEIPEPSSLVLGLAMLCVGYVGKRR